jgi:hypothetical protein
MGSISGSECGKPGERKRTSKKSEMAVDLMVIPRSFSSSRVSMNLERVKMRSIHE